MRKKFLQILQRRKRNEKVFDFCAFRIAGAGLRRRLCRLGFAACAERPEGETGGPVQPVGPDDPSNPDDPDTPHEHSFGEWVVTVPATCTAMGEEQRTCSCGEIETREIAALGHTEVVDEAVTPTCTETGLTEGRHCSVCGEVLVEQEVVPALDHDWDEGEVTTPATCTQEGVMTYTCTRCGDTRTETIAMKEHTEAIDAAVAPTCTETGLTEGKHCSVCARSRRPRPARRKA